MKKTFDIQLSTEQLVSLHLSSRKINKIASKVADCNNIDESDTNTRKKRGASTSLLVDVFLKLTRGEKSSPTLLNGSSGSIASSNNNNDSSANDNIVDTDTDTELVNHGDVDSNGLDEEVELLKGARGAID